MSGRAGCYLRVSTDKQDEESQRQDIERFCEMRRWEPVWFVDHAKSGRSTDGRDSYHKMMREARRGRLKRIVVWKFDRLGRTAVQLIMDLDSLRDAGADLVSVQDMVDTSTPMGRAMFQIIAVLAELEVNTTSERTKATYRARKARAESLGQKVRWGAKPKDLDDEVIRAAAAGEISQAAAARRLGVHKATVSRRVRALQKGGSSDAE